MEQMKVSLILPVLNEALNLEIILPQIPSNLFDEIIVVDGGSNDNSIEVVKKIIADPIIINQKETGKGNAMKLGAMKATGEFLIFIDADGSMNLEEASSFIDEYKKGYEFVKGSRSKGNSFDFSQIRFIGNTILTKITNLLYRTDYTDITYGYFGISKKFFELASPKEDKFTFDVEICILAKKYSIKSIEIPSIEYERIHGVSNLNSIKDGLHILWVIIINKFKKLKN